MIIKLEFLFIFLILSTSVLSVTSMNFVTIGQGDLRWCKLTGCSVTNLIVDSLIVQNLSVIGDVFNVTMIRVNWTITDSFNVGGNLEAKNGTFENLNVSTNINTTNLHVTNNAFVEGTGTFENIKVNHIAEKEEGHKITFDNFLEIGFNSIGNGGDTITILATDTDHALISSLSGSGGLDVGDDSYKWRDLWISRNANIAGEARVSGDVDVGGNVETTDLILEGHEPGAPDTAEGGLVKWEGGATAGGYTYSNYNSQFVWDKTTQATYDDTGVAWVDFDDGSASFAKGNFTIGSSGAINIDEDSAKFCVGEAQDGCIYYDSQNMIIDPKKVGSGQLKVLGNLNVTGTTTSGKFKSASATSVSGTDAVAFGFQAQTIGSYSFTAGYQAITTGCYSASIGRQANVSTHYGVALGSYSTVETEQYGTAVGYSSTSSGSGATAVGFASIASGQYAVGIGREAIASGTSSVAIGPYTSSQNTGSMAVGNIVRASADNAMVMGYRTENDIPNTLGIGFNAAGYGSPTLLVRNVSVDVLGNLNVTGTNATFEQDVTIKGTLHGGSPVKIEGINITNNVFMLEENRNSSSRFTLQNINSGENATAVITAKNDVGGTMSIGIGSSNFMIGNKNYQNITALFSKSRGDMIFANFFKEAFIWLYNPSDDNDANNLVEIMRLDEKGLNMTKNITASNVFLPQYIFSHNNETISLLDASVWTNLTFTQEEVHIKLGISHTHNDITNTTFTISEDGVYDIDYDLDVIDTSASSTDIDVAGRTIYSNGTEIDGSVFETDITKKDIETEVSHDFLAELRAGDSIVFQFVADDADVVISTHGNFGDHPESATIRIFKIANLP